jgi:hypothetical protein
MGPPFLSCLRDSSLYASRKPSVVFTDLHFAIFARNEPEGRPRYDGKPPARISKKARPYEEPDEEPDLYENPTSTIPAHRSPADPW